MQEIRIVTPFRLNCQRCTQSLRIFTFLVILCFHVSPNKSHQSFDISSVYNFTVPPNKIFVHLNPVQVHFHLDSVLWFNSFALNLHESLLRTSVGDAMASPTAATTNEPSFMYMDVKLEAIMPRVACSKSVEKKVFF